MNEINVLVEQKNGVLEFNFDEIKAALTEQMNIYNSLVFTEEQKAEAKKDVATLRKLKTAIDTKRKDVKKSFMQPYDEFESKVKELTALIDEPINLINKQVTEFDAKVKAEKQEKIKEAYAEVIGDMAEVLTLDKIYKKEWENVATSLKSIKQDIENAKFHYEQDIAMLENFNTDCIDKAKAMYISNGYNINPVIAYIQQYEQQKKEVLEREQARKEAEEKRLEEEKRKAEEQKAEEQAKPVEQEQGGFIMPEDDVKAFENIHDEEPQGFNVEPKLTVIFTVTGTQEQIDILRQYIRTTFTEYSEV